MPKQKRNKSVEEEDRRSPKGKKRELLHSLESEADNEVREFLEGRGESGSLVGRRVQRKRVEDAS